MCVCVHLYLFVHGTIKLFFGFGVRFIIFWFFSFSFHVWQLLLFPLYLCEKIWNHRRWSCFNATSLRASQPLSLVSRSALHLCASLLSFFAWKCRPMSTWCHRSWVFGVACLCVVVVITGCVNYIRSRQGPAEVELATPSTLTLTATATSTPTQCQSICVSVVMRQ